MAPIVLQYISTLTETLCMVSAGLISGVATILSSSIFSYLQLESNKIQNKRIITLFMDKHVLELLIF